MKIQFFVPGVPAPGGSKKAFVRGGRAVVVEDCKRNGPWRDRVASFGRDHIEAHGLDFRLPLSGPLEAVFTFTMPRPKSHFHTSKKRLGQLRENAPFGHTSKPDTTKLIRAAEDALKGILWHDDSQIIEQSASKHYGDKPGCWITVWSKD